MNKKVMFILLSFVILAIISCTAGPNDLVNTIRAETKVAGFWQGLWHGLISPVTFIVSLFKDTVSIYEVHNNGGWYNFGFLFGAMMIFGGGGKGCCSKK